jgi:hypothetical protein
MTRIRVLHREVELIDLPLLKGEGWGEVKKIDRSAEALRVRHHPLLLSLRNNNLATTPRRQLCG